MDLEKKHFRGSKIRDIILGSQDGLVNVLGVVLGVAAATNSLSIILVAAFVTVFTESISMAAVAYTSTKAQRDFYAAERAIEEEEIKANPKEEIGEIRQIYYEKGFRGKLLNQIVKKIISNDKVWVDTMISEELHLPLKDSANPASSFLTVLISAFIGALVPVLPFLLLPLQSAKIATIVFSTIFLFLLGTIKARLTVGNVFVSGIESSFIGIVAAVVGYAIGHIFGLIFGVSAVIVG
ncbi:MAG TPA: VIT1/CCC1 transporter family protein [archaeon]|nr:VIT1/CCC1 transporter family protein [archaeon]